MVDFQQLEKTIISYRVFNKIIKLIDFHNGDVGRADNGKNGLIVHFLKEASNSFPRVLLKTVDTDAVVIAISCSKEISQISKNVKDLLVWSWKNIPARSNS